MVDIDLLVFGSGSLARTLVMALAARPEALLSVMVAGRNKVALGSIALLARARAAALDGELSIASAECDYSEAALDRLFAAVRPRIVVVVASLQSPWSMGPRWRELVSAVGYGLTLPLQAMLADVVFRALRQRHPAALCINGCYPDMVNRLLVDRGIAVVGGIGNIAILASLLRSVCPKHGVRVLAHHAHIAALIRGRWDGLPPPLVWLDSERCAESYCASLIEQFTLPKDNTLNAITGAAAIPMLQALAGRSASWEGHAPGVNGLVGGYPVHADASGLHVVLPSDLTLDQACAMNRDFGRFDGIALNGDTYQLTKTPNEIERATGIRLSESLLTWRADALEEQAACLGALRSTLDPRSPAKTR
jgi:hypothetical protein